jgi:pimeloyl-ACP methyl ester carboxylesterase
MMPNPPAQRFRSRDGLELAYRELGVGRPLVLIHGYFSTATVNWLRYGHAAKIAARGYRVIMPDLRMLARGATPARAIIAGMGLEGITNTAGRSNYFRNILTHLGTFKSGSAEWMAEAFLKTVGGDPIALLHVLDTFVDTPPEALERIRTPALVLVGTEDDDNGSGQSLATALPQARYVQIAGNHMSAVTKPELGAAMAEFLGDACLVSWVSTWMAPS